MGCNHEHRLIWIRYDEGQHPVTGEVIGFYSMGSDVIEGLHMCHPDLDRLLDDIPQAIKNLVILNQIDVKKKLVS